MAMGKMEILVQKNEAVFPSITSYKKKITSEWFKEFNVRLETIKPLDENIGEMLHNIGMSKEFFFWRRPQRQGKQKPK
jgi:hypothetical protein